MLTTTIADLDLRNQNLIRASGILPFVLQCLSSPVINLLARHGRAKLANRRCHHGLPRFISTAVSPRVSPPWPSRVLLVLFHINPGPLAWLPWAASYSPVFCYYSSLGLNFLWPVVGHGYCPNLDRGGSCSSHPRGMDLATTRAVSCCAVTAVSYADLQSISIAITRDLIDCGH